MNDFITFPFLDLPQLVQSLVVENFADNPADIASLRISCKSLQETVEDDIGLSLVIPEYRPDTVTHEESIRIIESICENPLRHLTLRGVPPPFRSSPFQRLIHFPEYLRSVSLSNVPLNLVVKIFNCCKLLETFQYLASQMSSPDGRSTTLHELIGPETVAPINAPQLKTLVLAADALQNDHFVPFLIIFGGISAPKLKKLSVKLSTNFIDNATILMGPDNEWAFNQRFFYYLLYAALFQIMSKTSNLAIFKFHVDGESILGDSEVQPLPPFINHLVAAVDSEPLQDVFRAQDNARRLEITKIMASSLNLQNLREVSLIFNTEKDFEVLSKVMGQQQNVTSYEVKCAQWTLLEGLQHSHQEVISVLNLIQNKNKVEKLNVVAHFCSTLDLSLVLNDFSNLTSLQISDKRRGEAVATYNQNPVVLQTSLPTVNRDSISIQFAGTLWNLDTQGFLKNLKILTLQDFFILPTELTKILDLGHLRKLVIVIPYPSTAITHKVYGMFSSDLAKALLTLRKLDYVFVDPVIFRIEDSFNIPVNQLGSSGQVSIACDRDLLTKIGKLRLYDPNGRMDYHGRFQYT